MADVVDMIRASVVREEVKRDQIRRDFPDATDGIDKWRAVFGPGVKPLYFEEGDKTMGKQQPFDGMDVDKLIRLDDMDTKRRSKSK